MKWRSTGLVLSLLLSLLLSAGYLAGGSLQDPSAMSDQEILEELQQIWNRQQTKSESSQVKLPTVRQLLQKSQPILGQQAVSLMSSSTKLDQIQGTMTGLSNSLMSFAEDMEKEFRNLRILNSILVGTTAVLVLTTLIIVLVSAPP